MGTSSAIQLTALCLLAHAPTRSLGFQRPMIRPPIIRPSLQPRGVRRSRGEERLTFCSMQSLDDDVITEENKDTLNGAGRSADSDPHVNGSGGPTTALARQELTLDDGAKKDLRQKNPRMEMFRYLSQPIVEVRIIGLVFLSCFLQAINTLDDLPPGVHHGIDAIDTVCVYIFAVEFFLRWWSAGRFQLRYLTKPLVSIDALVVILPLFVSGILPLYEYGTMAGFLPYVSLPGWLLSSSTSSALLNLRLLRILKLQRVLTDENTFMNFEMALGMIDRKSDVQPYQLQLARVIISIFTLVSVSTGLIYTAEHEANPLIPDYFTALYFGLTTLTTVGFGDISPVTPQGRLVVSGSILAGVAIIPAQAASLAEAFLGLQMERAAAAGKPNPMSDKQETTMTIGKEKCDACGAGPHRSGASFCWSCGKQLD